mgnify:CR=1 FL=1
MKIYVYYIKYGALTFEKRALIAEDFKQADEYICQMRRKMVVEGDYAMITGPFELNDNFLVDFLVPKNISGKKYQFKEFRCELEEKPDQKTVCDCCDPNSYDREVYYDSTDGEWYFDIETGEWNDYLDCFVHVQRQINYCPYCGRHLPEKGE